MTGTAGQQTWYRRRLPVMAAIGAASVVTSLGRSSRAQSEDSPPAVVLSTFGSLAFAHSDEPTDLASRDTPSPHPSFYLGQVILFGTGKLSDHADVLFEIGFESERDEVAVDPERAYVQYAFGDYLRLWAGRFHSHVGYFNNAFHHGQYLYSTAFRPRTIAWEDMGGILPIHLIGLSAGGRFELSRSLWARYAVDVGNGRPDRPEKVAGGPDFGRTKTIVGQLALELPALGMEWGIGAEASRIPGLTDAVPPVPVEFSTSIDERIYGAHFAWVKTPVELIFEGYLEDHHPRISQVPPSRILGTFLQGGYDIGSFRPYARVERIAITRRADDPYFLRSEEGPSIPTSFTLLTAGLRYEIAPGLVVKAEYERQIRPAAVNVGVFQFAWGL